MKTGDLILCASDTVTGLLIRSATHSKWNHIGIAIESGDDFEVLHATGDDKRLKREKLSAVLARHTTVAYRPIQRHLIPTAEYIEQFTIDNQDLEFSFEVDDYMGGLGVSERSGGKPTIFCSELVRRFYSNAARGIDPRTCFPDHFSHPFNPSDIFESREVLVKDEGGALAPTFALALLIFVFFLLLARRV